jgi:hypothetical protein
MAILRYPGRLFVSPDANDRPIFIKDTENKDIPD